MIQRPLQTLLSLCTFLFCSMAAFAQSTPAIGYQARISGLSQPVDIVNAGDGSNRLFVVQKGGTIRAYDASGNFIQNYLTVTGVATTNEGGLLSAAFHPNYESNGYVFVYYTRSNDNSLEIARYTVSSNSNAADPASRQVVLNIPHPTYTNHNGGKIIFGPDGFLYLATGDGGSSGDPSNNAQNGTSLLGKMLRINVNTLPYTIPTDNPYVSNPAIRDEIWALGLRNPFRWSFDRDNGNMWIADVGQGAQEEINFLLSGATGAVNYGWRCYEGLLEYNTSGDCLPPDNYVRPIFTYGRNSTNGGNSVTGGFVYRGTEFTSLAGYYIFADYGSDNQWVVNPDRTAVIQLPKEGLPVDIVAFGEAENGTLYAASLSGNAIYKVVDNAALPATFGSISAYRKNNLLHINWYTETESNSSHFNVQASTDGKTFTTIKTVNSKATGGNSSERIVYNLQMGEEDLSTLLSLSLLVAFALPVWKRRKYYTTFLLLTSIMIAMFYSCAKSNLREDTGASKIFIRIAQVDKDGSTQYAQTVQVVNE